VVKIVAALGLKVPPRDLKSKDSRHLLSVIFTQWLSLSTCIIQAVIDVVPPPSVAQRTRIARMLHPDMLDVGAPPRNKLEEDLYSCNSKPDASVVAFVSKMFAVPKKDLPESKRKALSADEMRRRAREVREARQHSATEGASDLAATEPSDGVADEQLVASELISDGETVLGFARIYSGTLSVGRFIHALLPKYNHSLGPSHPSNAKHMSRVEVQGLYVMMGRELTPVESVAAGNVFAIRGLEGAVWRSATLCAPNEMGAESATQESDAASLVNLGGLHHAVRIFAHSFMHRSLTNVLAGIPDRPSSARSGLACGHAQGRQWSQAPQSIRPLRRDLPTADWRTRHPDCWRATSGGSLLQRSVHPPL
jgi:ribosome assembly protein 1